MYGLYLLLVSLVISVSINVVAHYANRCEEIKHEVCFFYEMPSLLNLIPLQKNKMCWPLVQNFHDVKKPKSRFLMYDVNPGEGFNLRRDVFLRAATLVYKLSEDQPWTLVLPPWGNLYHWKNEKKLKFYNWKEFFNLDYFSKFISVMDLEDYIKDYGPFIDESITLQQYAEGWGDKYEEKYDFRPCLEENNFSQISSQMWQFSKWSRNFQTRNYSCLSFQGQASSIIPLLKNITHNLLKRSVFIDRAETLLHDEFGGSKYWAARRSMKFAPSLIDEANLFRQKYLSSNDQKDKLGKHSDVGDYKPQRAMPNSMGGPYLAVHLRRRDFLYARRTEVPDIKSAADQLKKLLRSRSLKMLFVATDAPSFELEELRSLMAGFKVFTFTPSKSFFSKYGDGGVAIVDQIICSHARHFVGTFESTFSFRIQEEREILGFSVEDTFNRLCGTNPKCEKPTKWTIVY